MRILLADDDRDTVLTLTAILEDEGHEVRGLTKGTEVLPTVRSFSPEVVILDISMPDLTGLQLAKEICAQYADARPLLIAISGIYNRGSDRILSEVVGFAHHLPKPCVPEQILSLLGPRTNA